MNVFSAASQAQFNTVHQRLQMVLLKALEIYDFAVIEGFRNQRDQDIAFAKGNSQKRWPNGEHNQLPSLAADIQPYPVDWSDTAANIQRQCLLAGIVLACAHQLGIHVRWGGDWNQNGDTRDEHFRDYGHFEVIL